MAAEHPAMRALARRFVAGTTIDDGLGVAAALNERGYAVTLDHLGEHTRDEREAGAAAATYLRLVDEIEVRRLDATVSLKLTQLGIDLDQRACECRLEHVVRRAQEAGTFVRIDMESAAYTERTLALFARVHERHPGCVGPVIQSYLYRSGRDVRALIRMGARVRLCKGAYAEPAHVAFPEKHDVDENFVRLMELLLLLGNYPALATHDERIIDHARRFAAHCEIGVERFEPSPRGSPALCATCRSAASPPMGGEETPVRHVVRRSAALPASARIVRRAQAGSATCAAPRADFGGAVLRDPRSPRRAPFVPSGLPAPPECASPPSTLRL